MLRLEMIGHLGRDAEMKIIQGKTVINFSMAHTERYTNAQGVKTERTIWVDCEYWEADKVAPYLKKGTMVFVEGMPRVEAYMSKQSGEAAAALRLRIGRLELLNSTAEKPTPQQDGQQQTAAQQGGNSWATSTDDKPFG